MRLLSRARWAWTGRLSLLWIPLPGTASPSSAIPTPRAASSTAPAEQADQYMKFGSRKTISAVTAAIALCLLSAAIARSQGAQAQRPQMAEEVFKNVQIIKGIPVDEFMD